MSGARESQRDAAAMRDLAVVIVEAMTAAAISGLCRDGQLEIGVQAGRAARPDLEDTELLGIAEELISIRREDL